MGPAHRFLHGGVYALDAVRRASSPPNPTAAGLPTSFGRRDIARSPTSWRIEWSRDYEVYSNGLRIENQLAVANEPRWPYQLLERGEDWVRQGDQSQPDAGKRSSVLLRTQPAGIVFHTTESDQAPFEATQQHNLHRIGLETLLYVRNKRAYHFVIDRFGGVHRIVVESDAANHAGNSVWADSRWLYLELNQSFLGVSFEASMQTGESPINEAQVHAAKVLTEMLRSKYNIAAENCVTHAQVSVNPDKRRIGWHSDWGKAGSRSGRSDCLRITNSRYPAFTCWVSNTILCISMQPVPEFGKASPWPNCGCATRRPRATWRWRNTGPSCSRDIDTKSRRSGTRARTRRTEMKTETPKAPLWAWMGTSRIVAARQADQSFKYDSQLNAFVTIPYSKMTENVLRKEGVPYSVNGNEIVVHGNESERFADLLQKDIRRTMARGILNSNEPDSVRLIRDIATSLAGKGEKGQKLCYTVPAAPLGAEENLTYHEATLREILTGLGYDVQSINEGLAVVYGEMESTNYTGIGISCGGGLCNVCFAYLSVPILSFSIPKAGDFIDASAASVMGSAPTACASSRNSRSR